MGTLLNTQAKFQRIDQPFTIHLAQGTLTPEQVKALYAAAPLLSLPGRSLAGQSVAPVLRLEPELKLDGEPGQRPAGVHFGHRVP